MCMMGGPPVASTIAMCCGPQLCIATLRCLGFLLLQSGSRRMPRCSAARGTNASTFGAPADGRASSDCVPSHASRSGFLRSRPRQDMGRNAMKKHDRKAGAGSAAAAHTVSSATGSGSTSSGPSHPAPPKNSMAKQGAEQNRLAAAMESNDTKAAEYGYDNATQPRAGAHATQPSATSGASTLSEANDSDKTGAAATDPSSLPGSLAAARVNDADQVLTTNQGVAIAD